MLSQGVPMLAHGDELGRTQSGNNNVYCQDNETSWVDWSLDKDQQSLITFAQRLTQLRKDHAVFRRRRFFAGTADHGGESDLGDIAWFTPAGEHMSAEDWSNGYAKALMVFYNGDAIPEPDPRGQPTVDDSFLVVYNAHHEKVTFTLPSQEYGVEWQMHLDTAEPDTDQTQTFQPTAKLSAEPRSVVVLHCPRAAGE